MFSKEYVDEYERDPEGFVEMFKRYMHVDDMNRLERISNGRGGVFSVTVYGDERGITVYETDDDTGAIGIIADAGGKLRSIVNNDEFLDLWDKMSTELQNAFFDVENLIDDAISAYITGNPSTHVTVDDPEYDYAADFEDSEDDE